MFDFPYLVVILQILKLENLLLKCLNIHLCYLRNFSNSSSLKPKCFVISVDNVKSLFYLVFDFYELMGVD